MTLFSGGLSPELLNVPLSVCPELLLCSLALVSSGKFAVSAFARQRESASGDIFCFARGRRFCSVVLEDWWNE